jgi:hypothetical protein
MASLSTTEAIWSDLRLKKLATDCLSSGMVYGYNIIEFVRKS